MIITDLSARNILKYTQLELHDLPEQGIIAIDGSNESGKSSIGEMICFALFGRTYSLGSEELGKLINWGETDCSVTLGFRGSDGVGYEITRLLDRDGNQGARLNRVGAEEDPIARGAELVQANLHNLLGFTYEEFIESFYLAQREITTPHPHSHAVKAMAGLTFLELIYDQYGDEIPVEQELASESRTQADELDRKLEDLGFKQELLDNAETQRNEFLSAQLQLKQEAEKLEQASGSYQDLVPSFRSLNAAAGTARFLRFLSFALAAVLLAGWGFVTTLPEHPFSTRLVAVLTDQLPQWGGQQVAWLLYGGILFGLLYILFWWRIANLRNRMESLRERSRELGQKMKPLDRETPAEQQATAEDAEQVDAETPEEEPDTVAAEQSRDFGISRKVADFSARTTELRDAVASRMSWIKEGTEQHQKQIEELEQTIRDETLRRAKAEELNGVKSELEQRISEHERRANVRMIARDLLVGASQYLSQRFNRDLRDLVGRTLPLFTEERYEYLHIDEDLAVRVFSKEKRDFMNLEEISSGTQRQIMLAVRLALSQELVNKTVKGKQFLFLDEPFAFFDQERTRRAIQVLPELSDDITQIWVVAQEFPPDQKFDVKVACAREQGVLALPG